MAQPERPRFPDGFWWGTGNSSNQCEGAAPAGDWLPWETRKSCAAILATATASLAGTGKTSVLLASIGLNHFRLSLEWARLEPAERQARPG